MKLFLFAILVFFSTAIADSATQTGWSGGPGSPGPSAMWGDDFSLDTGTSWYVTSGTVGIAPGVIEHAVDSSFDGAWFVDSADMDGDGDVDVLGTASFVYNRITWWENADGLGAVWIEHTIGGISFDPPIFIHAADVDSDGDMDVLGASQYGNNISWWENTDGMGESWIRHNIESGFPSASCVSSGDIDGDGSTDVVGSAAGSDDIAWWDNTNGTGTAWIKYMVEWNFDGARSVQSADIDGDGDEDILGAAYDGNAVAWWENVDGAGVSWTSHSIDGSCDGAVCVRAADMDGDGDLDAVCSSIGTSGTSWWENSDGSGTSWIQHFVDASSQISVLCADLDGDGDIDLGGASQLSDVAWWQNANGLGTDFIEHPIDDSFEYPVGISADDFDGDGMIDVLAAAYMSDAVAWWDLFGPYPGTASLESSILYIGGDPDWGALLWSAQTPPSTSISFQVRASDDYTQMGVWSDTLSAPCSLHGLLADNASYVQYRAILETANPDTTPSLLDVTVTWDPLGTGGSEPSITCLLPVIPNPSGPSPSANFSLAETGAATLYVYDLSGRLVREFGLTEYPAGNHNIQLQPLGPGIYFLRMQAGEFTANQRFVVVE